MQPGDGRDTGSRSFADGVITRRGTFQRYFKQAELRDYVCATVGRDPVSVGPGIVFVFRRDDDEQNFLARRQHSVLPSMNACEDDDLAQESIPRGRPSLHERHRELLDAFWTTVLELGRMPEGAEFDDWRELASIFRSTRSAFNALQIPGKAEALAEAARRRADDLLVYLALNLFERRRSATSLSPAILCDIRSFFVSHKSAMERAKTALFECGSVDQFAASVAKASASGLGVLAAEDGDYTFHVSRVDQQPVAIRILLGCAERLEPAPPDLDLVKVHGAGTRVSYLRFDDFSARPIPLLARRVIVDLRRRRVDEATVKTTDGSRTLLGKAHFMPPDAPGRERQERFDDALRRRGVFTQDGLGPPARVLSKRLAEAGITPRTQPVATQAG
jgi:DNA phosphorothioation-associated putative methyltransferase